MKEIDYGIIPYIAAVQFMISIHSVHFTYCV